MTCDGMTGYGKGVANTHTLCGSLNGMIINESGLYKVRVQGIVGMPWFLARDVCRFWISKTSARRATNWRHTKRVYLVHTPLAEACTF